jgi:pantothenate synthetase
LQAKINNTLSKKRETKMKKYAIIMLAVLGLASCSDKKFHVEGEITEAEDSVLYLENVGINEINAIDGLEVEYFSIVDGNTLQDVANWEDSPYVVGCITVYCGKTPIRLIDHIKYKEA